MFLAMEHSIEYQDRKSKHHHAAGRGELHVIFTHIDEAAPAREYSFGVHIHGEDVYEGEETPEETPFVVTCSSLQHCTVANFMRRQFASAIH